MKKWKDDWNEMLPCEKKVQVAAMVSLAVALIVFVFEVLDKFGVLPVAFDLFIISRGLIAVSQACETVVYWRRNRQIAHAFMATAICFGLATIWDIVKLFI